MKVFYLPKFTNSNLLFASIAILGLSSCGTYQSAYNDDDGIYSSSKDTEVIVKNDNYDNGGNYFSKSYEEYSQIANEDLITDINDFQYIDEQPIENDSLSNTSNSSPWGYSNNASVSIYLGNNYDFFGNSNFSNYYNRFGYNYRYPYHGFYNSWRYGGVNYAYFNPYGSYYDYYCPPYYNSYYGGYGNYYGRNSQYYRNYDSYGVRATAYNSRNNVNRRVASNRTNRRSSEITNRNTRTSQNANTRTIKDNRRSNSTTRRTTTRKTPSTVRNNNTRTRTIRNTSGNTRTRSSSNNSSTRTNRTPSTTRNSSTRSTRTSSSSSKSTSRRPTKRR